MSIINRHFIQDAGMRCVCLGVGVFVCVRTRESKREREKKRERVRGGDCVVDRWTV